MALILKDLNGNAYPVETVTNHTVRMNSDGMLTFSVIENDQTAHFINDISKMWRVENVTGDAEAQAYVIVIAKRKATKHKQYIEVTAKEEQFDYLETHRVYENVTGSRTGVDFLNLIFDGTPYSYTLLEGVYAKEWENAGDGQSRFEMFLNWLERYGFEFQYEPTSKTFKLGERISRRPAYYISKKLNANDISFEEDATNFYTYARGYFDYDGADNIHAANQIREYPKGKTSPMIELFGVREAPPVSDGRVTDTALMDDTLEKQVEQSLKMSIELDFVTLGHNYPFAQPEIGDEIPVIDETINFNRVLRIQEIKTTRDAHHKVIKQTIVVGDPRREVRYKKAQSGAVSAINDLMAGRTKIKESVLPAAIKESTQMLIDTASELSFSEQGIMAVDKDNPNYVTLLNSSGLGVSKDGGQTFHNAITRGQINADLITTGSLNADLITTGSLNADLITTGSLKADRIRGGTFYGEDMTLESSLIINNINKGIRGNFIYTDTSDSYIPRKYTGEYRINNQALWFKGNIWRDTGQFLGFNTTFFAHDSVKFRRYENEDDYDANEPSTATLDLTHQHLRLKRDGYPELKLENTGIATIPQIVGMYEIMNRERNFGINVAHSNGGADLEVGVDQQGGFVKSNATYWRTTSGNANVYIGESGALYRSSSATKYKTDINREAPENYKAILNLSSANWIDKGEFEHGIVKQRYYGHIAEDLVEIGLPEFVEYGKDQEVESIMYERLISPLLEVVKDHEKQIKQLEAIINEQ